MKTLNLILGTSVALALAGCPGDDSGDDDGAGSTSNGATDSTGTPPDDTTGEPPDDTTGDEPGTTTDEPGTTTDEPGTTGDETGTTGEPASSFEMDVWPILEANCLGGPGSCHDPGAGGLSFPAGNPGAAYGNLVGVASTQSGLDRVAAGDALSSYLFAKITGTQGDVGGSGSQMPLGAGALSGGDITTIETWINDGAEP
ncbi:MAG: hypothetical protein AB1Z98_16825 [Nannocystaceae bacterium]